MSWLDVATYVDQNLLGLLVLLIMSTLVSFFLVSALLENTNDETQLKVFLCLALAGALISATVAMLPTHDKMVRLKIAKIKNEAITEANLSNGVKAIERIVGKLECKYLGCEEKKD